MKDRTFRHYKDSIPIQSQKSDMPEPTGPENGAPVTYSLDRRSILNIVKRRGHRISSPQPRGYVMKKP